MQQATFTLNPRPPFSLELTAGYHTYFRAESGADVFQDGVYRRLLEYRGQKMLVLVESKGDVQRPRLEVTVAGARLGPGEEVHASGAVARILGLDTDLEGFYRMCERDTVLEPLVGRLYGLHPPLTPTVFEGLVLAICGQQIASAVARMIRTLLIQSCGPRLDVDGRTYFAFPGPGDLISAGLQGLREIKLSTRKAEYILDIASRMQSGSLDLEGLCHRPKEEVSETLRRLRGVGDWTVQWVQARALGYTDAFPAGDLALRRTISSLYLGSRPLDAAEATEFARRWEPYRALITTYLFAAMRLGL